MPHLRQRRVVGRSLERSAQQRPEGSCNRPHGADARRRAGRLSRGANMQDVYAPVTLFWTVLVVLAIVAFLAYAIRILREYERGVVFTLGRFWKVKGPGLVIIVPFIHQMVRI